MKQTILYALLAIIAAGCGKHHDGNTNNAIYHWKTTFDPTEYERRFIREHGIDKLYIRFFDVAEDVDGSGPTAVPIATTVFRQRPGSGFSVVPVVFITTEAIRQMSGEGRDSIYAKKIVTRIDAICRANGIGNVSEVQLDCDWTGQTRDAFFALCSATRKRLSGKNISLSVTIRLHQLRQSPPPADRGVLMVYNTGSLANPQTANSIISTDDIWAYMKHLYSYPLPLDVAYPTFRWSVVQGRDRLFLMRRTDFSDTALYGQTQANRFRVKTDHRTNGTLLCAGDRIRVETSDYNTVAKAKRMIEQRLPTGSPKNIILYHLNSTNLSKFSNDEIQSIYRRR